MDRRVIAAARAAGVKAGLGRRMTAERLARGGLVATQDPDRGPVTALAAGELALGGIGVHVAMLDAAQAASAADRFSGLYGELGLTVACLGPEPEGHADAYTADVTYGDFRDFVFDYLRDHLAWSLDECVQRGRPAVILDDAETMLAKNQHMYIKAPPDQVLASMGALAYFRAYAVAGGLTRGREGEFPEEGWWFQRIGDQRDEVYGLRDRVLRDEGVRSLVLAAMDGTAERHVRDRHHDREDLWRSLRRLYPASDELRASELPPDALIAAIRDDMRAAYRRREEEFSESVLSLLEPRVICSVLDRHWRQHLAALDALVDANAATALPGRFPAPSSSKARHMYTEMMAAVREDIISFLFNLDVNPAESD